MLINKSAYFHRTLLFREQMASTIYMLYLIPYLIFNLPLKNFPK